MVFPYMDHDLAGLLENERVKLQPSHIKLYMKQLLEGTEYMHRVSRLLDFPLLFVFLPTSLPYFLFKLTFLPSQPPVQSFGLQHPQP